jgi:hypothetical protein
MPAKVGNANLLSSTCGVGLLYNFTSRDNYWGHPRRSHARPVGGCGWNIAGFVNDQDRKEVYEYLKSTYKIVTQSPVRRNNNSGNSFFYVMYDCKKPRRSKNNPEGKWDLSGNDQHKWPWKK